MQAIYTLSAFVTQTYTYADEEVRAAFRTSTLAVAGVLLLSMPFPEAGQDAPVEMRAMEDSHLDLSLAEVVARLEESLPRGHKPCRLPRRRDLGR